MFHILDPAELEFPVPRPTLFKGLEGMPEILTEPHALRRAYQESSARFLSELKKGCRMMDIDYVPLRTDQILDVPLSSYLASRGGPCPLNNGASHVPGTPRQLRSGPWDSRTPPLLYGLAAASRADHASTC